MEEDSELEGSEGWSTVETVYHSGACGREVGKRQVQDGHGVVEQRDGDSLEVTANCDDGKASKGERRATSK